MPKQNIKDGKDSKQNEPAPLYGVVLLHLDNLAEEMKLITHNMILMTDIMAKLDERTSALLDAQRTYTEGASKLGEWLGDYMKTHSPEDLLKLVGNICEGNPPAKMIPCPVCNMGLSVKPDLETGTCSHCQAPLKHFYNDDLIVDDTRLMEMYRKTIKKE